MAIDRVNEIASLINDQIKFHEKIQEVLIKANALSEISVSENFLDHDRSLSHSYLWVLSDLIHQASLLHEESMFYLSRYIKIEQGDHIRS